MQDFLRMNAVRLGAWAAACGLALAGLPAAAQTVEYMPLACKVVGADGGRLAAEVTSKQPEGLVGKQILVQTDGSNGLTKYNVKRADIQHLRKGRAVQVVLSLPARNCLAAFKTVMPAS